MPSAATAIRRAEIALLGAEHVQQAIGLRGIERLEENRRRVPLPSAPVRATLEQLGPRHAEEQDRRVAAQVGDVLHQVEEPLLAPVQVVEHADERPLSRDLLEQLAERPGDLVGRGRRIRLAEEHSEWPADGVVLGDGAELLDDLDHGAVRDPLAVRETAPVQHERVDLAEKLGGEPRLADAGDPEDREELARAVVAARANASCSPCSSRSRPTIGVSSRRGSASPTARRR